MKKIFTIILVILGISILLPNYIISVKTENKVYNNVNEIPKNKVGLVLGTSKWNREGGVNLFFKYRIDAVVELYNNGKIEFILVSGDNSTIAYNEPEFFKKELIKRGIPKEKIFLDYAGFRTLDSVIRAYKVFNQQSYTVISQEFHNKRAIYIASLNNINAIGFNAKDVTNEYGFKVYLREYLARTKVFIDILFNVKSKFLGPKIEIK
ncbi:ElyC/SanA/YdcF family protein [Wenyingzhuangia sp. chi5]|uniref:ElyC/SanA/YdcF family protein n=1 Tax=Wenyingzhuangia gilva TaxID=3057677 RepID=A0ABT8VPY4_9FLAO|nr:ElyC/SanA/YdcF family protein [Wenyingzhuangia sp. chi5]MDO3694017.1 ElyC/SanA/YdcF family protein [Wenyingzhuangia sp. chi5]